jgi:hypothetical protein
MAFIPVMANWREAATVEASCITSAQDGAASLTDVPAAAPAVQRQTLSAASPAHVALQRLTVTPVVATHLDAGNEAPALLSEVQSTQPVLQKLLLSVPTCNLQEQ